MSLLKVCITYFNLHSTLSDSPTTFYASFSKSWCYELKGNQLSHRLLSWNKLGLVYKYPCWYFLADFTGGFTYFVKGHWLSGATPSPPLNWFHLAAFVKHSLLQGLLLNSLHLLDTKKLTSIDYSSLARTLAVCSVGNLLMSRNKWSTWWYLSMLSMTAFAKILGKK